MRRGRAAGAALLGVLVASAVFAPLLTPHSATTAFTGYEGAPPMPIRFFDEDWRPVRPYVYPLVLVNRLERRYAEDRSTPMPVQWFTRGTLASIDESRDPWLPLGADPLGRDVFARLLYGTRLSLGVAVAGSAGALLLGLFIGGAAGFIGGRVETALMIVADFILVLPAMYVVLAIRASLPLVLSVPEVFAAITGVLALAGWPVAARGVRAIVASERQKEYAEAAYALGAPPLQILLRHLLPATTGFLLVTWTLMLPAFVLTEATMSLVGLGFPVPAATWGTMMRDAWQGGNLGEAPWLLAPAVAVAATVLSLHLILSDRTAEGPAAGTFS